MEVSVKKLREYVGINGKYVKNHGNLFYVDRSSPEEDYVIVNQHYIIVVDKNAIQYDSSIREVKVASVMEAFAKMANDIEYTDTQCIEGRHITVCRFNTDIWINRTFFKEFLNGVYSDKTGFAKGITFTGIDKKSSVMMWYDDELLGYFLPINH